MTDYSNVHASDVHTRCEYADEAPTVEMVTVLVINDGSPDGGNVYYEELRHALDHIEYHLESLFDDVMAGEEIMPSVKVARVSRAFLSGLKEADWL